MSLSSPFEDTEALKLYRDLGIARVRVGLSSDKADVVLPVLDRLAALMRQVQP